MVMTPTGQSPSMTTLAVWPDLSIELSASLTLVDDEINCVTLSFPLRRLSVSFMFMAYRLSSRTSEHLNSS